MFASSKNSNDDEEVLHPLEVRTREYRAMRGKRTGGNRVMFLFFMTNEGTHDRHLAMASLKMFDPSKDGSEIIMEFSDMMVRLRGQNLHSVAAGISAGWVASLEAFDPARRDPPGEAAPLIETMAFYPFMQMERGEKLKLVKPS